MTQPPMQIHWKLKDFLHNHGITVYRLAKETRGQVSRNSLYNLTGDPKAVTFETLEAIIPALRKLTGEDVNVQDLLEYAPAPEPEPIDEEARVWLEANLAPPLEPYDWGDVDPMSLGEPVRYIPGQGFMTTEGDE